MKVRLKELLLLYHHYFLYSMHLKYFIFNAKINKTKTTTTLLKESKI